MTAQFDCQNSNNSLSYQVNVIVFSEILIVSGRLGNGRWSVLTQTIPPPDRACPHLQLGKLNNSSSDSLLSHSSRPLPPSPHNLLTPLSTVTLLLAWTLSPRTRSLSVPTQTIPPPDRAFLHLQLGKPNNSSNDSLLSHSSRPLPLQLTTY